MLCMVTSSKITSLWWENLDTQHFSHPFKLSMNRNILLTISTLQMV